VLQADVPLRTSLTVATRVGQWPEWILATLGIGLLLAAGLLRRTGPNPAKNQHHFREE
jgi:apolipoprotein N-acyltransferase